MSLSTPRVRGTGGPARLGSLGRGGWTLLTAAAAASAVADQGWDRTMPWALAAASHSGNSPISRS